MLEQTQLPINRTTLNQLNTYLTHPYRTYIFSGPAGSGKLTSVLNLLKKLIPESSDLISSRNWANMLMIEPLEKKKSIGINQIKEVESLLSLVEPTSRFVIVDQAHLLTREAQNAFLKTLEEAPSNVSVVLLTESLEAILPTVRSRSHTINFYPLNESEFTSWMETEHPDFINQTKQIFHITSGAPGRAKELLTNEETLRLNLEQIEQAKIFLISQHNKRLQIIKPLGKQRNEAQAFLASLETVCEAALVSTAKSDGTYEPWLKKAEKVVRAAKNLKNNANTRLTLLQLVLDL